MDDKALDSLASVLPPLLQALESLQFLARHLHPPEFGDVLDAVGTPDAALRDVRPRLQDLPEALAGVQGRLQAACDAVTDAFAALRAAVQQDGDMRAVMRALRQGIVAQEALYPLATATPAVHHFFLNACARAEAGATTRTGTPAMPGKTGLIQFGETASPRGNYALYVPETYTPDRAWPLVMALHGGSGNGRLFLWNWLRDARSAGAILVAPTAHGSTWALTGEDVDTPNLMQLLAQVRSLWNVDPRRILLTGMSDGGTFSYVSGLAAGSPFTHLAPVAGAFHPLLMQVADRSRLRDLPIYLTHGALDWMFPVEIARMAQRTLGACGARVTYREIEDLSHCYPTEVNADILQWLARERA